MLGTSGSNCNSSNKNERHIAGEDQLDRQEIKKDDFSKTMKFSMGITFSNLFQSLFGKKQMQIYNKPKY